MFHPFKSTTLSVFILWLPPAFWSEDMTLYLVFSAFTSRPIWLVNFVSQFILQIFVAVFFQFFLYKDGLLLTSHINFSTPSTIDIAVWRKTQGLCTLLQPASNCARSRMKQCSPSGQLKLPVRALSYEAVFSIRATKVASAHAVLWSSVLHPGN